MFTKSESSVNHASDNLNFAWHAVSASEIMNLIQTNAMGLSEAEVQKREIVYGKNLIQQQKKKSKLVIRFKKQQN